MVFVHAYMNWMISFWEWYIDICVVVSLDFCFVLAVVYSWLT